MKGLKRYQVLWGILTIPFMVVACAPPPVVSPTAPPPITPTLPPSETPAPIESTPLTPTATLIEATPAPGVMGPIGFPDNVNPLTGLEMADSAVLRRRPLLIKVSNESSEVRPQSGLSFADHVWEYQMEGWGQTRFTAVYLSQAPERVGSVRSTRLIDTDVLVPMYGGLLVTSGASAGVGRILLDVPWANRVFKEEVDGSYLLRIRDIPVENTDYYHSLFAIPEAIWDYADEREVNGTVNLEGLAFSEAVPDGGQPISEAIVDYPLRGPLRRWTYDQAANRWLSSTEDQREKSPEKPDIDLLTNEQLAFDNVVILYAEHYLADFIEDEPNQLLSVGIILEGQGRGYLLRDGQTFEIKWQRDGERMIQLLDAESQIIPLKPGNVWFNTSVTGQEFGEFEVAVTLVE